MKEYTLIEVLRNHKKLWEWRRDHPFSKSENCIYWAHNGGEWEGVAQYCWACYWATKTENHAGSCETCPFDLPLRIQDLRCTKLTENLWKSKSVEEWSEACTEIINLPIKVDIMNELLYEATQDSKQELLTSAATLQHNFMDILFYQATPNNYSIGWNDGYNAGKEIGPQENLEEVEKRVYNRGFAEGRGIGYDEGYEESKLDMVEKLLSDKGDSQNG